MPRRLPRLLLGALGASVLAACSTAQPTAAPPTQPPATIAPTLGPSPTAEPTVAATPAPTPGPFEGQPYTLDLPDGWVTFDLSDPAGAAALEQFVAANPEMGAAIEAFKALPNVTMAVNLLLGNVVVALALPTGGLSLDVLGATFTTQFAAVPGVVEAPQPEQLTLPAGPAFHWALAIQANDPNGGTFEVGESIYLVANESTAVLVEFVEVGGVGLPQEQQIIQSLRFTE